MVILYAVGGRALLTGMRSVAGAGKDMVQATQIATIGQLVLTLFIGLAASIYVLRRPARGRRGWAASLTIGAGAGALGAGVIRAVAGAGDGAATGLIAFMVVAVLVEEIVLRGIVQRALPVPPLAAAAITVIVGVVSAQVTGSGFTLGAAAVVALVISHMLWRLRLCAHGSRCGFVAGTRVRRRCCGFHLATVWLTMITMRSPLSPARLLPLATSRLRAARFWSSQDWVRRRSRPAASTRPVWFDVVPAPRCLRAAAAAGNPG